MLGFSLQTPVFLGKPSFDSPNDLIAHYDRVETLLAALKESGVRSIECRILPRSANASSYRDLFQLIWSMGLELTIHGHVAGEFAGSRFADIYPSMRDVLEHFHQYQSGITMAIHAFDAKTGSEQELHRLTVQLLKSWSAMAEAEQLPIRFALENNRKKTSKIDPGDSLDGVLRMVDEIDSPHVGITWDMGHFYSNLLSNAGLDSVPETPLNAIPPQAFLQRVYHTHIHGIGESGTHNSLAKRQSLPLELYVTALREVGYSGIYNLELTMNKFDDSLPLGEHVLASVKRLRATASGALS